MTAINQAEQYLLDEVRRGNEEAWSQLVARYQGRLLAFARGRIGGSAAEAEDLVQDTFVSFLKSLPAYKGKAGIETYLFTILRRRVVDVFRSGHRKHICLLHDSLGDDGSEAGERMLSRLVDPTPTATESLERVEDRDVVRQVLADALEQLLGELKRAVKLRDIEAAELVFYCQAPNREVARLLSMTSNAVAVAKHRWVSRVREEVLKASVPNVPDGAVLEGLLGEVWETRRLSCPKRSTVGAYLLETLDDDWTKYVDFHLNTLGCCFCRANLEDLRQQDERVDRSDLHSRILASSIGFFRTGARERTRTSTG